MSHSLIIGVFLLLAVIIFSIVIISSPRHYFGALVGCIFFDRKVYNAFKEVKQQIKSGVKIPFCPLQFWVFSDKSPQYNGYEGYYIIVTASGPVLFKDGEVVISSFYKSLLVHLINMMGKHGNDWILLYQCIEKFLKSEYGGTLKCELRDMDLDTLCKRFLYPERFTDKEVPAEEEKITKVKPKRSRKTPTAKTAKKSTNKNKEEQA